MKDFILKGHVYNHISLIAFILVSVYVIQTFLGSVTYDVISANSNLLDKLRFYTNAVDLWAIELVVLILVFLLPIHSLLKVKKVPLWLGLLIPVPLIFMSYFASLYNWYGSVKGAEIFASFILPDAIGYFLFYAMHYISGTLFLSDIDSLDLMYFCFIPFIYMCEVFIVIFINTFLLVHRKTLSTNTVSSKTL